MAEVKVIFKYEGDDDDDPTGVSEATFNRLMDEVAAIGGYDVEIEKE